MKPRRRELQATIDHQNRVIDGLSGDVMILEAAIEDALPEVKERRASAAHILEGALSKLEDRNRIRR